MVEQGTKLPWIRMYGAIRQDFPNSMEGGDGSSRVPLPLSLDAHHLRVLRHHWLRSDDRRFFHDHASNFVSIILKGHYKNVTLDGTFEVKAGSVWKSDALKRHYLEIPKGGAWTLLFCGRPYHKWGFYVNDHKWRPLRYFHKFGIIQDENYQ